MILLKALGIWFLMVIAAILNGTLRDNVVSKSIGNHLSLPLSGVTLSVAIFLIVYFTVAVFGTVTSRTYIAIGFLWLVITLIFEFGFGHYVAGKSWRELVQVFNVAKGNLFILVLVVTTLSPWLAAKLKSLI
jgi:hypothetical protein